MSQPIPTSPQDRTASPELFNSPRDPQSPHSQPINLDCESPRVPQSFSGFPQSPNTRQSPRRIVISPRRVRQSPNHAPQPHNHIFEFPTHNSETYTDNEDSRDTAFNSIDNNDTEAPSNRPDEATIRIMAHNSSEMTEHRPITHSESQRASLDDIERSITTDSTNSRSIRQSVRRRSIEDRETSIAEESRSSQGITRQEEARASSSRSPDFNGSSGGPSVNEDSNSTPLPDTECDEPPAKIRKICPPQNDDNTDGETCPICLEPWGNSGNHRLVSLKCGHLFGSECVTRWLKAKTVRDRACPTCKSKANIKDLRYIYARRLVAADNSQITALQKQIETIQAEKSRCELELQKSKIAHRACSMQLEVLRSLMKSQENKEQPVRKSWRFALEKNLEICKDGGCRVLTYNCRTYELYVSQKSSNNLFPGYGIRKVSCVDYKLGQFLNLHPKPIRDITYSQPRDLLLSVALDRTARIVERGIQSVTVDAGLPLWSCSWDYLRSNEFYVGGVGGVVHQYDVRNPSTYIQMLSAPGDVSPVVSLCSTEFGLLSCQLNSSWLWLVNNREWEPRALPIEGSFMSLCYDNDSQRALISSRPSANGVERSKLTLCKLKSSVPSGEILFDIEDTFFGSARSSLMSRPTWVKVSGASWIAAHSESDSALYLHGLDGSRTMSLPAAEPALDVGCVELNGSTVLAALSESRLKLYKAVPTNT